MKKIILEEIDRIKGLMGVRLIKEAVGPGITEFLEKLFEKYKNKSEADISLQLEKMATKDYDRLFTQEFERIMADSSKTAKSKLTELQTQIIRLGENISERDIEKMIESFSVRELEEVGYLTSSEVAEKLYLQLERSGNLEKLKSKILEKKDISSMSKLKLDYKTKFGYSDMVIDDLFTKIAPDHMKQFSPLTIEELVTKIKESGWKKADGTALSQNEINGVADTIARFNKSTVEDQIKAVNAELSKRGWTQKDIQTVDNFLIKAKKTLLFKRQMTDQRTFFDRLKGGPKQYENDIQYINGVLAWVGVAGLVGQLFGIQLPIPSLDEAKDKFLYTLNVKDEFSCDVFKEEFEEQYPELSGLAYCKQVAPNLIKKIFPKMDESKLNNLGLLTSNHLYIPKGNDEYLIVPMLKTDPNRKTFFAYNDPSYYQIYEPNTDTQMPITDEFKNSLINLAKFSQYLKTDQNNPFHSIFNNKDYYLGEENGIYKIFMKDNNSLVSEFILVNDKFIPKDLSEFTDWIKSDEGRKDFCYGDPNCKVKDSWDDNFIIGSKGKYFTITDKLNPTSIWFYEKNKDGKFQYLNSVPSDIK